MTFRPLSSAIGIVVFALLAGTGFKANAEDMNLYERVHEAVTKETMADKADKVLLSYLSSIAKWEDFDINEEEVEKALEQKELEFCMSLSPERGGHYEECSLMYRRIQSLAQKTQRFRALGRDLLSIAAGYEVGTDGFMGEPLEFPGKLPGILHIWGSNADHLFTPMKTSPVRAASRPQGLTDDLFGSLDGALTGEGSEEIYSQDGTNILIPAVWRYRYGLAAFIEEPCSEDDDGTTELYALTDKRYCDVERAMEEILTALPDTANNYDPPLKPGEAVIFPSKKLEGATHVIVWMKAEVKDGKVKKDIGLSWDIPLDPVLPGLEPKGGGQNCMNDVRDESYCNVVDELHILPGGLYPDPPEEPDVDEGICAIPLARNGYLCRPLELEDCNEDIENKDPRSIILTRCQPELFKTATRVTQSGPDVCSEGWWRIPTDESSGFRDTAGEDPDMVPGECSNCAVDVYCSDDCNDAQGFTWTKNKDGVVKVCISNATPRSSLPFLLLHELTHAQQFCSLSEEKNVQSDAESCCAAEHEAYLVSCRAEADAGYLKEVGVSIEECASALSNFSCKSYGEYACSDIGKPGTKKQIDDFFRAMDNESPDAPSCQEMVENLRDLEPRAAAMKENMKNVCSPGCRARYENSIGNNMCYIGQCIEQSVEESRLIPGRMTYGVQDESFPWDSCAAEDPRFGSLLTIPAFSPPVPPAYNPALLIESLDRALCQINGMPSRTPPVLCQFGVERQLELPLGSHWTTAFGLGDQPTQNMDPSDVLQKMTQSMGTRIGTELFAQYLSWAAPQLLDTLRMSNQLLSSMGSTRFPLTMCPRNAANEPTLCEDFAISSQ